MNRRLIWGLVFFILGILFIALDFVVRVWVLTIWGLIFFVIGLVILFNRGEDEIEGRKDLKVRRSGK